MSLVYLRIGAKCARQPVRAGIETLARNRQQVIERAAGSTLSFRMSANGPVGSQYTGYALKLRDNATGKEVYAGAFGRGKVQQACKSQGWSFS